VPPEGFEPPSTRRLGLSKLCLPISPRRQVRVCRSTTVVNEGASAGLVLPATGYSAESIHRRNPAEPVPATQLMGSIGCMSFHAERTPCNCVRPREKDTSPRACVVKLLLHEPQSSRQGSNLRSPHPKCGAMPTSLRLENMCNACRPADGIRDVPYTWQGRSTPGGIRTPNRPGFEARRSDPLSYRGMLKKRCGLCGASLLL
jgi:hypothetical protein